ncbi:Cell differentiation family, Rcd1-like containing protein [Trichomonas vaginalis G3]|uniref:Cell differentiation family, Rcd1-like containing protein n=1 Tax=Trichomonas vaginalis (strain ATCC PRA-98 / G3) TaxID=412133 RepID=A2FEP5_TRIV3|nr:positive regulation of nuclear receptor transcription coactivator protein [Trichomonas vaginalis G3]EAX96625.1 Cell differentiation family, Rcd1-like containing protein [Trichomonas vaginalis G3]KAI5532902.1 positive regulation of nuclear receptor transcription coactivator protein [Trichomonas vaginalis G3]|eukprot:XP_001309555.1 Cell differentiation family, Rcd1-like containing protein [Trichomonas vaginalis G3]
MNFSPYGNASPYAAQGSMMTNTNVAIQHRNNEKMLQLVRRLTLSPKERAEALHILSVQREQIPGLAPYLWYSPATITALLSEIISIYPYLATNNLNIPLSNRVCNVLTLFQCVAGHDETRTPFVRANIPIYLFPFLHQTSQSREAEYFKLTSLGIIGSLVKAEQPDIIEYLLKADFVPLCLRILQFSQEISRTVAAFIIQKILSDAGGKNYICSTREHIETVLKVLNRVVCDLTRDFSSRLAKHVIGSYQILFEIKEVRNLIASLLPAELKDAKFSPNTDEQFKNLVTTLQNMTTSAKAGVQPLVFSINKKD